LPENVLTKIKAPPKPNLPIIKPEELNEADGILFGFPTRYAFLFA
jgi:NAD(P)H dehydrogenase (quinone)